MDQLLEQTLMRNNPENPIIPGNARKAFIPLIFKSWFRQLGNIQPKRTHLFFKQLHTKMQVAIDNCNKPNLTDLRQLLNANSGTLVIPYNLDELFLLISV